MTPSAKKWMKLHDLLFAEYGVCECPLHHRSPFELLVAVILSAQCRDDRVNMITPALFALAATPEAMAALPVEAIEEKIAACGLFRNKSRNLSAAAKMLVERFGGKVPETMEELTLLPGVGRKTANAVLGNAFGIPGFPVDTHVNRVLNRIGMVDSNVPEKIEAIVNAAVKPEYWTNFSHLLIWHGRRVCKAGKPRCENCVIAELCKYRGK